MQEVRDTFVYHVCSWAHHLSLPQDYYVFVCFNFTSFRKEKKLYFFTWRQFHHNPSWYEIFMHTTLLRLGHFFFIYLHFIFLNFQHWQFSRPSLFLLSTQNSKRFHILYDPKYLLRSEDESSCTLYAKVPGMLKCLIS